MKTEKNILIAFLLNISISIFEFFGVLFTNSVAILFDSIHDLGDAYFMEKKRLLTKAGDKEIIINWNKSCFFDY